MRQVLAIALLSLRISLRSRVILVLVGLILAAGFLLPLAIRHDGTPEGLIRLHLAYTLGISGFLLGLATLWAGCAAISQEADEKTLQLLLVKPVPRLNIWLGKWLALLLINAVLLAVIGIASAIHLRHQLRSGGFAADELARARQITLAALDTLREPLPDLEDDVRTEYETLRARGQLPPEVAEAVLLDSIRRGLLARHYSIPPGESRTWAFPTDPHIPRHSVPLAVQFKASSSFPGAIELQGAIDLQLGAESHPRDVRIMPGSLQTVLLPEAILVPPEATLTFANHGTHQATLFFDPGDGLVLRFPRGTFAANYLRALSQIFLRLALFAAIGVTLGTLFSMPVATFLSLVLILLMQLSGFVSAAAQVDRESFVATVARFGSGGHSHGPDEPHDDTCDHPDHGPSRAARATATFLFYVYRGTWLTLRPLLEHHAIDDLANANRIPPRAVLRDTLQQGLILPAALALFSTLVLKQREWALPSLS